MDKSLHVGLLEEKAWPWVRRLSVPEAIKVPLQNWVLPKGPGVATDLFHMFQKEHSTWQLRVGLRFNSNSGISKLRDKSNSLWAQTKRKQK